MSVKSVFKGILVGIISAIAGFFACLFIHKDIKSAATDKAAVAFSNAASEYVAKDFRKRVKKETEKIKDMKKEEVHAEFKRRFGV